VNQQLGKTWEEELLERGQVLGEARGERNAYRAAFHSALEEVARAEARGELKAYREVLTRLLKGRFLTIPEPIAQRIANADLEHLKIAMIQVNAVRSPEELYL